MCLEQCSELQNSYVLSRNMRANVSVKHRRNCIQPYQACMNVPYASSTHMLKRDIVGRQPACVRVCVGVCVRALLVCVPALERQRQRVNLELIQ